MMKKLPIGIPTLSKIINDGYVYVDKTKYVYNLATTGKYYFLCRPRRFGKSLFVDTLKEAFEGNKELFKGLYIYDKWDWSVRYPVIHISFAEGVLKTKEDFHKRVIDIFRINQQRLGIECRDQWDVTSCFIEVIHKARERYGQPVVILIDEYDKPILDNITDIEVAREMREGLKNLYSVIKGQDANIKFAFLTGVSKFSKTSLFSGLNNLKDISLDERYALICGYTQRDLEESFAEYLEGVDLNKVREWYNGYYWGVESLYNPFDILLFLDTPSKVFRNYWFSTGTPSFLISLIESKDYFLPRLTNLVVGEQLLDSFDIDNLDIEVILYQAGYLTIDSVEETPFGAINYRLKIPNKEVRLSFNDYIINRLFEDKEVAKKKIELYNFLSNQDLEGFKEALISLFASIPYTNYVKNSLQHSEGFYATVVYVYLQSIGIDIVGEDVTNRGRIDLTVKFPKTIYIMEIKVTNEDPLQQIKAKRYYEKYLSEGKDIYLIGISFDSEKKNVREIVWERAR